MIVCKPVLYHINMQLEGSASRFGLTGL